MTGQRYALKDLLAVCMEAAKAAGHHARTNASRRHETLQVSAHDVKLVLDKECQQKAEAVIRAHWKDHAILGEEGGAFEDGETPLWIVDPIDGTVNFMHGLPQWCSSVAVRVGGHVVAGAVYLPVLGELFSAMRGDRALLNGKPICVSSVHRLDNALIFTGLSKHLNEDAKMLTIFETLAMRARKTRLMGAAAVDICSVACGRGDGYFESSIHLWDVAAGGLILECAGGRVEILEQQDALSMRYLASNGVIHEELKRVVTEAMAKKRM